MDYGPLIELRRGRLAELEALIAEPDFFSDAKKASGLMREYRSLQKLLVLAADFEETGRNLEENRELAKDSDP